MIRIDSLEKRALMASISGVAWNDLDNSKTIDRGETIRSGVTVYIDENSDGTLDSGEPTTVTNSKGAYTFTGLAAGTYTIGMVLDNSGNADFKQSYPGIIGTAASPFNISMNFNSRMSAAAHNAFISAWQRWQTIITGDIEDITTTSGTIDDLELNLSVIEIDGNGGTLGQTLNRDFRSAGSANPYLPYRADLEFDSADFAQLALDQQLQDTVLHEMAHALGFTDEVWGAMGLIRGNGLEIKPEFWGANALAEYKTLTGFDTATTVPLEGGQGDGTGLTHWAEGEFVNELMTGFIDDGVPNPLSRLSIAAMEDIGYQVDYSAADTFDMQDFNPNGGYAATINETPGDNVAYAHNVLVADASTVIKDLNFGLYTNRAPTIRSYNVGPTTVSTGQTIAISARSVWDADGDPVESVSFYRESNGTAGLQGGTGGDTKITTVYEPTDYIYRAGLNTTGLTPGNVIIYARARDSFGKGSTRTAVVKLVGPAQTPTNFRAGRNADQTATLQWTDVSNGIDSFRIERSTSPGFETDVVRYTLPPGTTSIVVSDILDDTTYFFRIRGYNGLGSSRYTARVSV